MSNIVRTLATIIDIEQDGQTKSGQPYVKVIAEISGQLYEVMKFGTDRAAIAPLIGQPISCMVKTTQGKAGNDYSFVGTLAPAA